MKKYLILFVLSLINFTIFSQTFSIAKPDGTPINNNDIINFNNVGEDANLATIITNNGSSSIALMLVADPITGTAGADMEFCFGVCRWGITQGDVYGPMNVDAGASTGEAEVHFHNHSTESDVITYAFKFFEEGNETNAIHFTYKYDVNYVGIKDVSLSEISVYPSPASDKININLSKDIVGSDLIITNLLGKVVYKQVVNLPKKTIDISNFDKGIYFYSILKGNRIFETKKLIIK